MQLITDLPHEILQDIFLHVASYSPIGARNEVYRWRYFTPISTVPNTPSYRSAASPYSISHVCSQWRNIALNYPHLWPHLRVMKPRDGVIVHILKEWIGRAGSLPLHLSLAQQKSENWSTVKEVLYLFLCSIHRCVSLIISLEPPAEIEEPFEYLTTLDVQKPALLESVGVRVFGYSDRQAKEAGGHALANLVLCSPKIRWIAWTQSKLNVEDNVLQCWGNLKVLEIVSQTARTLVHIFSHCHNLETFIASYPISEPTVQDAQGLSPITLPRLTKLSIPAIRDGCSQIFKWLTAPALVELDIDVLFSANWDLVADMVDRSQASLRVLKISGDGFSEDAFLPILKRPCFVELKELRIADSHFQNTLRFLASSRLELNDGGKHQIVRGCRYMPHLERIVLERIELYEDVWEDEEASFSGLVEEVAKSRLGTCDLEMVQHLDVDLENERVSLTIPSRIS